MRSERQIFSISLNGILFVLERMQRDMPRVSAHLFCGFPLELSSVFLGLKHQRSKRVGVHSTNSPLDCGQLF